MVNRVNQVDANQRQNTSFPSPAPPLPPRRCWHRACNPHVASLGRPKKNCAGPLMTCMAMSKMHRWDPAAGEGVRPPQNQATPRARRASPSTLGFTTDQLLSEPSSKPATQRAAVGGALSRVKQGPLNPYGGPVGGHLRCPRQVTSLGSSRKGVPCTAVPFPGSADSFVFLTAPRAVFLHLSRLSLCLRGLPHQLVVCASLETVEKSPEKGICLS